MKTYKGNGIAVGAMALYLVACSSCERDDERSVPAVSASVTKRAPAPSVSEAAPPPPPERRSLTRREPLDPVPLVARRAESLERFAAARKALEDDNAAQALENLEALLGAEPLSSVVRLFESRAALRAGDTGRAHRASVMSVYGARGRVDLLTDALLAAGDALEKSEQPSVALQMYERAVLENPRSKAAKDAVTRVTQALGQAGPVKAERSLHTFDAPAAEAACQAIEGDVRSGRVATVAAKEKLGAVSCVVDVTLDLTQGALKRALAFRVDVSGAPAQRMIYVGLAREGAFTVVGPLAAVYGTADPAIVNDVVVDLQRIDVLRGGAPEVVVKLSERQTVPDVPLNEILEADATRVVLLTTDRGKVEVSRELMLEERSVRRALAPSETKLPKGYGQPRDLGKTSEYRMKVAWSGPNAITLTRVSGTAKPRDEGAITLFSE